MFLITGLFAVMCRVRWHISLHAWTGRYWSYLWTHCRYLASEVLTSGWFGGTRTVVLEVCYHLLSQFMNRGFYGV